MRENDNENQKKTHINNTKKHVKKINRNINQPTKTKPHKQTKINLSKRVLEKGFRTNR